MSERTAQTPGKLYELAVSLGDQKVLTDELILSEKGTTFRMIIPATSTEIQEEYFPNLQYILHENGSVEIESEIVSIGQYDIKKLEGTNRDLLALIQSYDINPSGLEILLQELADFNCNFNSLPQEEKMQRMYDAQQRHTFRRIEISDIYALSATSQPFVKKKGYYLEPISCPPFYTETEFPINEEDALYLQRMLTHIENTIAKP